MTADRGGQGRDHGSPDPLDTTNLWIVWGKGVQTGASLSQIRTIDTAATALWMLGVAAPTQWIGRPVVSAFTAHALAAAN